MAPLPELASERAQRLLWTVVGASVLVRLAAALYLANSVTPLPGIYDQVSYHALALRVLEGHGFTFATEWWPATPAGQPTAHWSFLYVLFLAAIYFVAGPLPLAARLIQVGVVGVLHPLLTYRIASRMFGSRVGVASASVVAFYAYFVYYSAALLTESFYILALLWAIDRAQVLALGDPSRNHRPIRTWVQLGAALAIAVLLRQLFLLVVPVVLGWALWKTGQAREAGSAARRWAAPLRGAAAAVLVIACAVLPWTARNYSAFHRVVLLNTNAGFAFYWGNHPIHGSRFIPILAEGTYQALIPAELRDLDEAALERALLRRGIGFVAQDPGRYVKLSVSRVAEYFKFWPSAASGALSNAARVLSFGLCLPFFVGGIVLALRARDGAAMGDRVGIGLVLAVALVYAVVHFLTWTLVRYRLPVDAILAPFAGLALTSAWTVLSFSRAVPERRVVS